MTFAQAGEDEWILKQFPEGYRGFAADVGAYDGFSRSNTFLLEQKCWSVLCVEANPQVGQALKTNRRFVQICACDREPAQAQAFMIHDDNPEAYSSLRPTYHEKWHPEAGAKWSTIQVPVKTLDQCLDEAEFPRVDVVSIDTEGTEPDVLAGFDLTRWNPKVLVIESWDEGACDAYLKPFGYDRVARKLVNDCYLRREAA